MWYVGRENTLYWYSMTGENHTFLKYWARTMYIFVTFGHIMKQVNDPFWHLKSNPISSCLLVSTYHWQLKTLRTLTLATFYSALSYQRHITQKLHWNAKVDSLGHWENTYLLDYNEYITNLSWLLWKSFYVWSQD
jgi:hypothetical protein